MRYTFFFLFLFCAVVIKAQEYDLSYLSLTQPNSSVYFAATDNKDATKAYKQTPYWKRYKVLRGFAWGALGVGLCGTGISGIAMAAANFGSPGSENTIVNVIFITSLGVTASSIPLFIFAHKNKRKAKRTVELSLNTSHIYMHLPNGRQQASPALGFCINF